MESRTLKTEYNVTKAFKKLFFKNGKLTPEAEIVISYLRDVCGARGELRDDLTPSYLYDSSGRFDSGAAAFLLGKRRVFDLIIRHLSLDETQIFLLISEREKIKSDYERVANILQG